MGQVASSQQPPKPKNSSPLEGPLQRTAIGDSAALARHLIMSDQFLRIVAALFHLDKNTFSWKEGSLTFMQQPFLLAKVDMWIKMNATCLKIKLPTEERKLTNGLRQPHQPHPRGIPLENIIYPWVRNLSIDYEPLICLFGKCLDLNYVLLLVVGVGVWQWLHGNEGEEWEKHWNIIIAWSFQYLDC